MWMHSKRLAACGLALLMFHASPPLSGAQPVPPRETVVKPAAKLNLNTASLAELSKLPGVSPTFAKQIIAHRPYRSVEQLSKAGASRATIAKIAPLVFFPPAVPPVAAKQPVVTPRLPDKLTSRKVDLNSATLQQLQDLPDVGPSMGAHIFAGRPYRNLDDLARMGVPLSTIEKIRPLVVTGP